MKTIWSPHKRRQSVTCFRLQSQRNGEKAFGGDFAAPHTTAQLVQLCQSKSPGALNDHDRGLLNINTHLNHNRAYENIGLAVCEALHGSGLLPRRHPPVQHLKSILPELTLLVSSGSIDLRCCTGGCLRGRRPEPWRASQTARPVSYTHLRAHETDSYLVCR